MKIKLKFYNIIFVKEKPIERDHWMSKKRDEFLQNFLLRVNVILK